MFTISKSALKHRAESLLAHKDTLTVLGFKIFGILVSYSFMLMATRWYGAAAWGRFAIGFAWLQLLAILGKAGQDMVLMRLLPPLNEARQIYRIAVLRRRSLTIVLATGLLLVLGMAVLASPLTRLFLEEEPSYSGLWQWVALALLPFLLHELQVESLRAAGHHTAYAVGKHIHYFGFSLGVLAISYTYTVSLKEPVLAAFIIGVLISAFTATVFWEALRPRLGEKRPVSDTQSPAWPNLLRMGWPFLLTNSINLLFGYVDTLMVGAYLGETDTGIYNAALKISAVSGLAMIAAHGVQARRFSLYHHQGDYDSLEADARRTTRWTFFISVPIAAAFWGFPETFLTLLDPIFVRGASSLRYLVLGNIISIGCGSIMLLLQMTGKELKARNLMFMGAILNFVLNMLLIPLMGIGGAALASASALAIVNVLGIWLAARQLGVRIHLGAR